MKTKTILYIASPLIVIAIFIMSLGVWIQGGGRNSEESIPTTFDDTPFRVYEAVVPGSPLKLKHFISENNEINVSSSLVMGEKEVIVFAAPATKYSAERLADEIEKTGRKLTYIYLSHPHLDHAQGAVILQQRFPDVKLIAEPKVAEINNLRIPLHDDMAKKRYGDNAAIPSPIFEEYDSDVLMLEGREIQLWHDQHGDVGIGYEDEPHTVVYIPDLKALLPNDICYFGGHMMMGGTTKQSRAKWKDQIRSYMNMDLNVVIPGHVPRSWSGKMTAKGVLNHSLTYIENYEQALESSKTSDEVIKKMLANYPDLGHTSALYLGTYINFRETHRLLFNPRLEKFVSFLPKSFVKELDKKMFEDKRKMWNL